MYKKISNEDFQEIIENPELSLIDVREENEFESGHIQGAVNMPLSDFQQQFQVLNPQKHHYLICQSGSRSAMACQFLAEQGYQVTNILGGTTFWKGELVHGNIR